MDFQVMLMQVTNFFNADIRWPFIVQNVSTPQIMRLNCMWNLQNDILANTANVTDEQRMFKAVYNIYPNGTYKVQDVNMATGKGILSGKLNAAKNMLKSRQMSLNNQNGQIGMFNFDFDIEKIHQPMDQVLQSYGLTKI